tara:strand:- start:10934 stop:11467 length:534 start_codon:yes stop_codon:yes gene_type:complete
MYSSPGGKNKKRPGQWFTLTYTCVCSGRALALQTGACGRMAGLPRRYSPGTAGAPGNRHLQQGDTVSEQEIREKTRGILADEENLRTFAELNNMTTTAARALLERLLREPVVSEKVEEHIFSGDSAESLKDYYAGEEKGYVRGHEAGFAKGAAVGVLTTLATVVVGGVTLYLKFRDN